MATLVAKNPFRRRRQPLGYWFDRVRSAWVRKHPNRGVHLVGMDSNEIMTGAQVAELLQVSVRTLEEWRLTKTGPPYRKMGKHVRYLRSEVLAWFEGLSNHG